MLVFPVFSFFNSDYSYISMNVNSQNYMLNHPVFPQHYNSLIQISKRWKKYPILYVIFPMVNHGFNVK